MPPAVSIPRPTPVRVPQRMAGGRLSDARRSAGLHRRCRPTPRLALLAVVQIVSGAVVFESTIEANSDGYGQALELAEEHACGRRAFAVEGTGSFGAGL